MFLYVLIIILEFFTKYCLRTIILLVSIANGLDNRAVGMKNPSLLSAYSLTGQSTALLDCLQVNNAGGGAIEAWGKAMFDIPVSDFDKMIEQNVKP